MRLVQSVKEKIMKNGLPEGYTRLEYLQSTGVQYIDTGFVPTSDNFQFEIRMFSQSTSAYLGYRSVNSGTATGDMRWFFNYKDGRVAIRYGDGTENSTLSFNTQTTHKFYFNGSSLYVDDVNYLTTTKKYATPVYKSFYLFSVNTSGYYSTDIANFVGRIYYAKIWDNDTLVRDFVPALDPSDKPCMYDLVSKQPFYNLGTGADFSIGKKLTPVEYIANTGSSYINTGYNPNSTTRVETKFKMNESPTSFKWLFLSRAENVAGGGFGFGCITNGYIASEFNDRQTSTSKLTTGTTYIIDKDRNVCKFNDSTLTNVNSTFTVNYPLTIFALNNVGTITSGVFPLANCYYFRIYDNDTLVRDLIPVRDENNVGYLLDLLTNTLYANAGSGSFAIGEDDLFVRNIGKTKFFKQTTRKVPRGFQEVEYLESTGTQYIDIGLKGKNNLDFEYKCEFTNLDGTAQCVGGNWSGAGSSTVSMYFGLIRTNENFAYHYDGTSSPVVVMNTTVQGTPYSIQGHLWKGEQYFVINGTKSSVGTIASEFTSPLNMYLFGINNNGLANPAYIKLHHFKLWDNGILVRDFVPYLDANGRPCMWDMVTKQPFYNQGTGEFSYGDIIKARTETLRVLPIIRHLPLNYLESTGTQYIDTGLLSTANSKVDCTFGFTSMESGVVNNVGVFGGRNAQQSTTFTLFKIASGTPQYFRFDFNGQPQVATANQMTWDTISKYRFEYNGTKYITTNTTTSQSVIANLNPGSTFTTNSICLFAVNTTGTIGQYLSGRIYHYWYTDGTNTIDLYPVLKLPERIPCMYDRISKNYFYNESTDPFLYG